MPPEVSSGFCPGKGHTVNKAKVLLVDDDPVILTAMAEFLRMEGYKIVQAANLKSACRLLEVEAPDLAVVDYSLPDGMPWTSWLRREAQVRACSRSCLQETPPSILL
jgi:response regulator RpfG family c-di-GMP phosphodiesterase